MIDRKEHVMKRIGILTGGGDAPGLNAVIRAAVKTAIYQYNCEVLGIRDGYDGFIDEQGIVPLTIESVRGLLPRGGTILGAANRGNPYARKVALIKHELHAVCTPEDYRDIMRAMIERAKTGDVQAAKFVYTYNIGKPMPSPDPDRLDFEEWQGLRESATWMDESPAILSRPSGRMALHMVRVAQPEMDKQRAREMNFVLSAKGKTEEKVREHLLDPVNGLEKLHQEMDRHQTGFSKKTKKRRG